MQTEIVNKIRIHYSIFPFFFERRKHKNINNAGTALKKSF